ncbi:hypothetical protein GV64_07765 [Endozoicomonas elysicola]|uniref:Uncharacterized protein n=2 Tax=Endozoicomonas elysicola TaxID=305900 RepID=A0A081K924_9GAMM|nr:hypothetical protein GV64_07765 [Endozoicomonas elysicola]
MIPENRPPSENKSIPPIEVGTKYTEKGFWRKAARVVSSAPSVIYRGLKWMASIPGKLFNLVFPKKKISERSVKAVPDPVKAGNGKKRRKLSLPSPSKIIKRIFNFQRRQSKENKKPDQTLSISSNSHRQDKQSTTPNAVNISATTPERHHQHFESSLEDNTDEECDDDDLGLVPLISDTDDDYDEAAIDPTPINPIKDDHFAAESVNTGFAKENQRSEAHTAPSLFSHKIYLKIGRWRGVREKQLDDLVHQLTIRRQKVQAFIRDTQLAFLRYGPSSTSTLQQLYELEESSLSFTRGLLDYNKKAKKHPKLSLITQSLEADFSGLRTFITDAQKYDFRSGHQYLQQVLLYKEVADRLLAMEKKPIPELKELKQRVGEVINEKIDTGLNDGIPVECVSENMDELLDLDSELRKIFPDKRKFDNEMIRVLSKNSKPFHSQFHVYLDGKWKKISTTYTPAAAMRSPFPLNTNLSGNRAPFEKPYSGMLCPSMERNTKHAVNMMGYTMKIDDRPVTSQIRVGCPYAYAEKSEKRREEVTLDRIKEIFTALLVQNHSEQLQKALTDPRHSPIDLTAAYLNLLSPDNIRHNGVMTAIGQDDEKKWVERIHKALKDLSGKEMILKVCLVNGENADVRIIPNVRMFVIPCNQLALQQSRDSKLSKRALNKMLRYFANTWKTVNQVNTESLKWLLGSDGPVRQKSRLLSGNQQHRVNQLEDQIRGLFNSKKVDFETVAKEKNPFIFAEILFQLLEELEIDIFSGCKSNKDRTSIFQTVLQSLLTTGMYLHESQSDESDVTAQLYNLVAELFMVYGGHTEVQKRNTGLVGYRLDDTPGKDLDPLSYKFMRRNPLNGARKEQKPFSNPDAPITL